MGRPNLALNVGKERLQELYHDKGLLQAQIAVQLACSLKAVKSAMIKLEIPRRPPNRGKAPQPLIETPLLIDDDLVTKVYLAASLDCEGEIGLHRNLSKIRPILRLSNTSGKWIEEMKKITGGHIQRGKPRARSKVCYTIRVQRIRNILEILRQTHPFLKIKRDQATLVMEFCESRLQRPKEPTNAREMEIFLLVKALNKRGV